MCSAITKGANKNKKCRGGARRLIGILLVCGKGYPCRLPTCVLIGRRMTLGSRYIGIISLADYHIPVCPSLGGTLFVFSA